MLLTLPKEYRDLDTGLVHTILRRIPRTMAGFLDLDADANGVAFDGSTFLHTVGLPFEIVSIIPRAVFIDANGQAIAAPAGVADAGEFGEIDITDTSRDQKITKSASFVNDLVDAQSKLWLLDKPYYIKNQYGFQVVATNQSTVNRVRVKLSFQGSLLVLTKGREVPLDKPVE